MDSYCLKKNDSLVDPFYNPSCTYNNTIYIASLYDDKYLGLACTTSITSTFIFVYAAYVLKKSFVLPNKQFFVLILSLILIGTLSGTYATFLLYLVYHQLASLPILTGD